MKSVSGYLHSVVCIVVSALILASCSRSPPGIIVVTPQNASLLNQSSSSSELEGPIQEVTFNTLDHIKIAATYYRGMNVSGNTKAVILVHMLNRDKSSWKTVAQTLQEAGFAVLAIDLRGHGESDLDWQNFGIKEWNAATNDIKRAKKFFVDKGIDDENVYLVGASIGANLALSYAVQDTDIKKVVLLSPGLDYRGVDIEGPNKKYDREVMYVAAMKDEYSYTSVLQLYRESPSQLPTQKSLKIYKGATHGTDLFEVHPDVLIALLDFMKQT